LRVHATNSDKFVQVFALGINHHTAPLDIREQVAFDPSRLGQALHDLRRARIGHLGHVLEAMLDMHTDPTAVTAAFGCHVVQCEPDEILRHYRDEFAAEIEAKKREILDFFDTPDPKSDPITTKLTDKDLHVAAKAAVALEKFIAEKQLDGLAYYYEAGAGTPMRELVTNLIVGNSLLTGAGFPMCGEYDLKTCLAMLIMDRLDIGGSFAEFHPVDFLRGSVLVGHDGPHHVNIADKKPVLRSLLKYHGKPGSGASVEFSIKEGPITMLSLGVKADGKFKFVVAEGESVPRPLASASFRYATALRRAPSRSVTHASSATGSRPIAIRSRLATSSRLPP